MNYQDILVFDPTDGMLSLRRLTLTMTKWDHLGGALGIGKGLAGSLGAMTSRSLPAGRLSVSPPSHVPSAGIGRSGAVDEAEELVARDVVIATWTLQRKSDWCELKKAVVLDAPPVHSGGKETGRAE